MSAPNARKALVKAPPFSPFWTPHRAAARLYKGWGASATSRRYNAAMGRGLFALSLALCALLLVGASDGLAHGGKKAHPRLLLTSSTPVLTVAGSHFAPRERVKVQLGSALRVARSTAGGTFVVRFAQSTTDPCGGGSLIISARGASGDSATMSMKTMSARACPPSP